MTKATNETEQQREARLAVKRANETKRRAVPGYLENKRTEARRKYAGQDTKPKQKTKPKVKELKVIQPYERKPNEELRQIEGFPGYWASSLGWIVSAPKAQYHASWDVLQGGLDRCEYHNASLQQDGETYTKCVHTLVGRAFNNYDDDPTKQWCHRPNPDKENNRADNLVWDYMIYNVHDRRRGENPNFIPDPYIRVHPGREKPFYVRIKVDGVEMKVGDSYATREEAQMLRDWVCAKHGIPLPTAEPAQHSPKPADPHWLNPIVYWWDSE